MMSCTDFSAGHLVRNSMIIWSLYMLKEAEIINQTGIMYLREGLYSNFGATFSGTVNLLNPTFSWTATGEDIRPKPDFQPNNSQSLLPYKLLSATTESELQEISVLLL